MAYLSITGTDADGRITKYAPFDSEAEAADHAAAWGGTVVEAPADNMLDYVLADGALMSSPRDPDPVTWTARQFMGRFTAAEIGGIVTAKASDAEVEIWWGKALAGPVESAHPDTAAGLDFLVGKSLLTAERRDQILDPAWGPA